MHLRQSVAAIALGLGLVAGTPPSGAQLPDLDKVEIKPIPVTAGIYLTDEPDDSPGITGGPTRDHLQ